MTADPGDPGEPRTLQDPLAESMRIVDLAEQRGPARPADGRDGDPGARPGLAGPDPPGRGRPRLRDPRQGPRRLLRAARRARATPRTSGTTRCSAASRPTSWTCRAIGRSTSWSTASRCAIASSSPTASPRRRRRCPWPSCSCRSSRSSRSIARTCSTRWSCSPNTRSPRTTAPPTRGPARAPSTSRASCRSPRTTGAGGGR